MSAYSVSLGAEHATEPTVSWRVRVWDLVGGGAVSQESGQHHLWVPALDTWMPDTVRLVLHELSAYIPAHDPSDALVRVDAKLVRRGGRAPKNPRPPRFNDDVRLSVEARGWRAVVETWRNDRTMEDGQSAPHPSHFTEPMQAFLLDLAGRSPFHLAGVRRTLSEPCLDNQHPSRLNVLLGEEAPWDPMAKEWRDDLADINACLRQIIERIRKDGTR